MEALLKNYFGSLNITKEVAFQRLIMQLFGVITMLTKKAISVQEQVL